MSQFGNSFEFLKNSSKTDKFFPTKKGNKQPTIAILIVFTSQY